MAEMPDGRILLGGRPAAAMFFDPAGGTFSPVAHPRGWFVEVLNPARAGGVWVLTTETATQRRHLERFDGARFEDVAVGSDRWRTLPPRSVLDLADGRFIVVPDGDGYGEGRGNTLRTVGVAEGVPFSPISALEVLRFICASTSPRRYSDSRLTSSPIAPSSLCWHRNATPRLKLGSRIDGIAIRKLLVSVVIANMALLYALLRYGVRVRGVQRFCGKNSIYTENTEKSGEHGENHGGPFRT